jgi:hypothetical protein
VLDEDEVVVVLVEDEDEADHPYGSTALIYSQVFKVVVNLMSPPIIGVVHLTSIHAPFFLLAAVFSI